MNELLILLLLLSLIIMHEPSALPFIGINNEASVFVADRSRLQILFVDIDSQHSDREIIFFTGLKEDTENPKCIFVNFLGCSW